MIRIKDIAEMADVSPTTVSNVLHGHTKKTSPKTVEKITRILEDLHYIPNMGARMLAKNGSKIIGVIINYPRREEKNAVQDPFNSALIGSLSEAIRSQGYYMMFCASDDVDEVLNLAATWNIDGLILLGITAPQCRRIRQSTNKPVVFIDSYFEKDGTDYENVGLEDEDGGYRMTRYLLENGHRRIAFLADVPRPEGVDWYRLRGCRKAMGEAGIPFTDRNYIAFSRNYYKRQEDFAALIHRLKEFTALFFASDYYAANAINVFYDYGISVPRDISVAGFDDNYFAQMIRPRLTTVRQDVVRKGMEAVRLIMKLIQGEPVEEKNIRLPIQLIVRDSVRNISGPQA